ncbi:MAG: hypothetical protein E6H07_06075 [Bacteroidetes bacterium]|nr:MAG: hypothetical protein E6H07_06075 [Bacteroidota bacterium]
MQELHTLDSTQLMDLLVQVTSDYTKMITKNITGEDYEKCKLKLKAIQSEIEIRKINQGNISDQTSITPPPDFSQH